MLFVVLLVGLVALCVLGYVTVRVGDAALVRAHGARMAQLNASMGVQVLRPGVGWVPSR